MIILRMSGGLGNQMFVYALYYALKNASKEVCIDDYTHYQKIGRVDNNLEAIFPLTYLKVNKKDYNRLTDSSMLLHRRVIRKLFGRKEKLYKEKDALTFDENIFAQTDCYCIGYWQSQYYFQSVCKELIQQFRFDFEHFPEKALRYKEMIENTVSVGIHIRHGDYLNPEFAPIYGGICTTAYYKSAISYIKKQVSDCTFYLFTDDADFGKEASEQGMVYVDCTDANHGYIDMALMSLCKHNIIANSSFSWWAAWLNRNPHKVVIAPNKWLNHKTGQDIYYGLVNVKIDENGEVTEE